MESCNSEWDRSKQKYFIYRKPGSTFWQVGTYNSPCNYICDYPAYYYDEQMIHDICFAESDDEVKFLSEKAFTQREKQRIKYINLIKE